MAVTSGIGVGEGVAVTTTVGSGVGVAVTSEVSVGVGVGVTATVGAGVGEAVASTVAAGVGVCVTAAVGAGVGRLLSLQVWQALSVHWAQVRDRIQPRPLRLVQRRGRQLLPTSSLESIASVSLFLVLMFETRQRQRR